MPRFVKKPKEFEAEQWSPGKKVAGVCACKSSVDPHLHTTHGGQLVNLVPGDWVVRESDSNGYYPIKDAIFREMVDEDAMRALGMIE